MRLRLVFAVLALAFAAVSSAAPKDLPTRKPGLWEIKMQIPDMPQAMTSQHCIDEKTDNLLQQQGESQARQQCSKNTVRKEGDKIIMDSVCKHEGATVTTHAVFSGDFTRNYRGEINATFSPPMHGMKSSKQTLEGKWLGACKPGQKPGDVVIPGMGSMNLKELMKNMPKGQ